MAVTEVRWHIIAAAELAGLIAALVELEYDLIAPVVRDEAIVYDRIDNVQDLPAGWTDEQAPGHYRLKRRTDNALFGYAVGPQSWKKYLHPADIRLWSAQRDNGAFRILDQDTRPSKRYAFLGVRSCELAAIGVQDRVLFEAPNQDPIYAERRDGIFIVAVQCIHAAATCFCKSMETGPQTRSGYDLALTEIVGMGEHRFLVEVGTAAGNQILSKLVHKPAAEEDIRVAQTAVNAAADAQVRHLDTSNIRDLLYSNFDHPRWDQVAERCLTCANCTLVCPTCFCTTVEDTTDLSGDHAERWRRLDSCFTLDFSYIHGGSVRSSTKARYRQWMTHKLASWIDQFGGSGCVGCGRCIAWCPVGIDITEELAAIRGSEANGNTETRH